METATFEDGVTPFRDIFKHSESDRFVSSHPFVTGPLRDIHPVLWIHSLLQGYSPTPRTLTVRALICLGQIFIDEYWVYIIRWFIVRDFVEIAFLPKCDLFSYWRPISSTFHRCERMWKENAMTKMFKIRDKLDWLLNQIWLISDITHVTAFANVNASTKSQNKTKFCAPKMWTFWKCNIIILISVTCFKAEGR